MNKLDELIEGEQYYIYFKRQFQGHGIYSHYGEYEGEQHHLFKDYHESSGAIAPGDNWTHIPKIPKIPKI